VPKIQEATLKELHPTQLTVGFTVVRDKKKHLTALSASDQRSFMKDHPMPAVIGPQGRLYITDHHHLGRAAVEAGVTCGFFLVEAESIARWPDMCATRMDMTKHPLLSPSSSGPTSSVATFPSRPSGPTLRPLFGQGSR
jgi:hypothetical protein